MLCKNGLRIKPMTIKRDFNEHYRYVVEFSTTSPMTQNPIITCWQDLTLVAPPFHHIGDPDFFLPKLLAEIVFFHSKHGQTVSMHIPRKKQGCKPQHYTRDPATALMIQQMAAEHPVNLADIITMAPTASLHSLPHSYNSFDMDLNTLFGSEFDTHPATQYTGQTFLNNYIEDGILSANIPPVGTVGNPIEIEDSDSEDEHSVMSDITNETD
jgi:hypothetical protein